MRLNRKWLYLGGLVTILTLLLTLTLALPAGAVGQLDDGSLSTDVDYVSPDLELDDVDDRTVKVTLSNSDLDGTKSIADDGDYDPVEVRFITVAGDTGVNALDTSRIRIDLSGDVAADGAENEGTIAGNPATVRVTLPTGDSADILPIIGDVSVDDKTSAPTARKLGTPSVINRVDGLIDIPIVASLGTGDVIYLTFNTSPQETALVNVEGDHADFDLLTVESSRGPAGDYSGSFVVAESVEISLSDGIQDEQHEVRRGLQTNLEFNEQEIIDRYWVYDAAGLSSSTVGVTTTTEVVDADGALLSDRLSCLIADDSPYPLADNNRCGTPDPEVTDGPNFPIGVNEGKVPGTGATSPTENADTFSSTLAPTADDPNNRTGDASNDNFERIFYIQVANPPIRNAATGVGLATTTMVVDGVNQGIELEDQDRFRFVADDDTATPGNGLVDAVRGILRVQYYGNDPLEADEPIEVSYRGSESFTLTVDRGPIQDARDLESPRLDPTTTAAPPAQPVHSIDRNIIIPSNTSNLMNASRHFRVMSVADGDTCDACVVRVGVVTNIGPKGDEDDVVTLPDHISVLGITYSGSQTHCDGPWPRQEQYHRGKRCSPGRHSDSQRPQIRDVPGYSQPHPGRGRNRNRLR